MTERKLTVVQAQRLAELIDGKTLAWSALPEWLTKNLIEENLVTISATGSRRTIRVQNSESCKKFICQTYTGCASLDEWQRLISGKASRSELVNKTGDSKTLNVRTFNGILVNCIEPLEVLLDGKPTWISPHYGLSLYIHRPEEFSIPEDVVIVGIENAENFCNLEKQTYLFPHGRCLFVSRYPQNISLYRWIEGLPNKYLHFGDFDLAGINIYLTEFYAKLGSRASMLIPEDIEQRLRSGNTKLFDKQYCKFRNMAIADSRVKPLYDLIMKYHRCYEQEGYIEE